ncbi:MAG TPA: ATP-binding protein [Miltoncostaeaceae bacterium]|nr:ATP-binding protein [Miltoncostaeaceae bacterium]
MPGSPILPPDIERARHASAPVETVVTADESAPARARFAIADVARATVGAARLNDVLVAVSEAVTNAVHHAYEGAYGEITIKVWPGSETLGVLVSDEGRGLDVPALFAEADRPHPGLGMRLMRTLASDFRILSPPRDGTSVLLIFRPSRDTAAA